MIKLIFKYEWLHFSRNRFQLFMVSLTIALGCYAIYYGCTEIKKQQQTIAHVKHNQTEQSARIQAGFTADTTTLSGRNDRKFATLTKLVWHRHKYAVTFSPSPLAPLSLGQRDLQPYYYNLSAMSLYYQIFQNEIANPQKLLVGNFDLSFVLVYLFPLLIIAFCYGLLSSEKDKGVLNLLKSQAVAVHKIILIKLLFYFLILISIGFVLSIAGFISSGASLILHFKPMALWLCTVLAYFTFWFSVVFIIISSNKNSSFNAIVGIGCWLFFLIIIPALINILITVTMPLNSNVLSGISRRMGVFNEDVEENHKVVIREFLKKRPDFNYGNTMYIKNLQGKGHAAFTVLNDEKSRKMVDVYQKQVAHRDAIATKFNIINPAVNAQNIFDSITEANLYAFQKFYSDVVYFHHRLVNFYYPKIFSDRNFIKTDYQQAPKFVEPKSRSLKMYSFTGILELLITALLLFWMGYTGIKKTV